MRRHLGVFAAIVFVAAALAVPAAQAARHMLVGMQDDAMALRGNPDFTFGTMKQLHVQVVRMNLNWPDVAKRRPAHPQDPADDAYDWTLYDRAIRYATQYGEKVMLTVLFTPSWANGGKAKNVPPTNSNDLRNFAYAAAERYSGHYIPNTDNFTETYLPAVKYWTAWNEPANPNWLQQVSGGRFVSPQSYAKICTAIWQGVHFTNFAGEKVACGVTGPRGNNQAHSSRPSLSPLIFMKLTKAAGGMSSAGVPRRLCAQPVLRAPQRHAELEAGRHSDHARQHQHADRDGQQAVGQEAHLDHRVRLADASRPHLRRLVRAPGRLRAPVVRDRPCESAHRHHGLVHAARRHEHQRRLAVGDAHGEKQEEAGVQCVRPASSLSSRPGEPRLGSDPFGFRPSSSALRPPRVS